MDLGILENYQQRCWIYWRGYDRFRWNRCRPYLIWWCFLCLEKWDRRRGTTGTCRVRLWTADWRVWIEKKGIQGHKGTCPQRNCCWSQWELLLDGFKVRNEGRGLDKCLAWVSALVNLDRWKKDEGRTPSSGELLLMTGKNCLWHCYHHDSEDVAPGRNPDLLRIVTAREDCIHWIYLGTQEVLYHPAVVDKTLASILQGVESKSTVLKCSYLAQK